MNKLTTEQKFNQVDFYVRHLNGKQLESAAYPVLVKWSDGDIQAWDTVNRALTSLRSLYKAKKRG